VLDDTLIYYILGDNGASAEGTLNGCFNELATPNGMPDLETVEFLTSKLDALARIIHEASWKPDSLGAPRFVHE
jgi:hypothetical protein